MECLLTYLCMVTVPHIMVGLERMLYYRGVGLGRFHCISFFVIRQSIVTLNTPAFSDFSYVYSLRRIRCTHNKIL